MKTKSSEEKITQALLQTLIKSCRKDYLNHGDEDAIESENQGDFSGWERFLLGWIVDKSDIAENKRQDELNSVMSFIDIATSEECAHIINEILTCHSNLLAFNPDTGLLAEIESVCMNGKCIQLNIERDEE